ncbi:MAG: aspartate kinase [Chitinophagaceae bacterium]
MKVFKFGGASIESVERIKMAGNILRSFTGEQLLLVISAMGKTTNALEKVTEAFYAGNKDEALQLFHQVKQQHLDLARQLLASGYDACETQLKDFFTEAEWLLHDQPVRHFDYYYDQVVCLGEMLSTTIVSHYLNETGVANTWMDVRDIIRTDNDFRDANIDWDITRQNVQQLAARELTGGRMVLTQGFVGATDENESTTLGREGSDYTAAVFANLLDAESQTIWKDVASMMNADPKQFPDTRPIPELNYSEVIEMAYYGAQIIHPKTIKPLQNKGIPLYVKCFLDPSLPGTVIHNRQLKDLPPIIVLKEKQVMLTMRTKDFSFVEDHHLEHLYQVFERMRLKPNLTQNAAISFICVLNDMGEKTEQFASEAAGLFEVSMVKDLSLLTIRHYTQEYIDKLTRGKSILLRQQTPETIQVLMR